MHNALHEQRSSLEQHYESMLTGQEMRHREQQEAYTKKMQAQFQAQLSHPVQVGCNHICIRIREQTVERLGLETSLLSSS